MKSSIFGCFALSLSATLLLPTACDTSQTAVLSPSEAFGLHHVLRNQSESEDYKASSPLIYAVNYGFTVAPLGVYRAKARDPKPIAMITKNIDNSRGACIDGDGTLYVTNSPSGTGWVAEYALGQTKPFRIITKGIDYPGYCAIDASGNLWVANIGAVDVVEYLKGSTKPHATITKGLTYPIGVAIDHAGNLYVSNYQPYSAQNVQVYSAGSTSPSRTITDGIAFPDGIAVDADGTLYVTTVSAEGQIEEYKSGESTPYRTITDKLSFPSDVVIGKNGWLYVADQGQTAGEAAIIEFPPHSVKASAKMITNGTSHPLGVAYYPPLLP